MPQDRALVAHMSASDSHRYQWCCSLTVGPRTPLLSFKRYGWSIHTPSPSPTTSMMAFELSSVYICYIDYALITKKPCIILHCIVFSKNTLSLNALISGCYPFSLWSRSGSLRKASRMWCLIPTLQGSKTLTFGCGISTLYLQTCGLCF